MADASAGFCHERLYLLREVLLNLLGKIGVNLTAREELFEPMHGRLLRLRRGKNQGDAFQHLLEAGYFAFQVRDAGRRNPVGAYFAIAG